MLRKLLKRYLFNAYIHLVGDSFIPCNPEQLPVCKLSLLNLNHKGIMGNFMELCEGFTSQIANIGKYREDTGGEWLWNIAKRLKPLPVA